MPSCSYMNDGGPKERRKPMPKKIYPARVLRKLRTKPIPEEAKKSQVQKGLSKKHLCVPKIRSSPRAVLASSGDQPYIADGTECLIRNSAWRHVRLPD